MSDSFDVVIIGGGIVGAACAVECASEAMSVAIIEAKEIGGGATAAGMGHIVVMDDSEAQFALTGYSQRLWHALSTHLPTDCEYVECGTIWVAADDEEMNEVKRKQEFYEQRRVPVEILDEKSLADAEPNLRKGLVGGLLVKTDGVIYPPCAARFLIEEAKALDAQIRYGHAQEITNSGVKLRDGSLVSGHIIVNAAGSWSPQLTPELDVQKRKGHLVITDRYPNFLRHQLVELGYLKSAHSFTSDSVAFNVQPRKTGQLLIGSSRQYGVDDARIDNVMMGKMLDRAVEYMPGLAGLSVVRSWTGFRAATPDKLPLIGPCPDRENLYLATGHEGLGITTSLATAKLLVDLILGRQSEIPFEPYLPIRAWGRTRPACSSGQDVIN